MKWKVLLPHLLFMLFVTSCLKPPSVPGISSLNGRSYVPVFSVSSISPAAISQTTATPITIFGNLFENGATVTVGGFTCSLVVVISSSQISCTTTALGVGFQDVVVTNPDLSSTTLSNTFKVLAAPSVTSIIGLNAGSVFGGHTINISGTDFFTGAVVDVGASPCNSVVVLSSTSLTCITSAHTAANVGVTVTNVDLQSNTLPTSYTYQPAPTVLSVSSATGPFSGLQSVTITGADFVTGASIDFDGSPCTGVGFTNSTTLTCTTPSHLSGAVTVTVTNGDTQSGSKTSGYTYYDAPTVSISTGSPSITNSAILMTIDFSEDVTGFTAGGIILSSGVVSGFTPVTSSQYTFSFTPGSDGLTTVQVNGAEGTGTLSTLGNTVSAIFNSVTYDSELPVCAITLPNSGLVNGTTKTINFSCSDNESVINTYCQFDAELSTPCDSTTSHNITAIGQGPHTLKVWADDLAGNLSIQQIATWTTDNVGPDAPTTLKFDINAPLNYNITPELSWAAPPSPGSPIASYEFELYKKLGNGHHQSFTNSSAAALTDQFSVSVSFEPGTAYYVKIRAIDGLGNPGDYAQSPPFITDYNQIKVERAAGAASTASAGYGTSMSMKGNQLVVGEPLHNSGGGSGSGARATPYVHSGSWTQGTTFDYVTDSGLGSISNTDNFGQAIAMSPNFMAVSAPKYSSDKGAVVIYELSGGIWTAIKTIVSPPLGSAKFGSSLAITDEYLSVGAPDVGKVYVYKKTGAPAWDLVKTHIGSSLSKFGFSVAMTSGYIFIGEPEANGLDGQLYYSKYVAGWQDKVAVPNTAAFTGKFGQCGKNLAISGDKLAVSCEGTTSLSFEGAVHTFKINLGIWTYDQLIVSEAISGDKFGFSGTLGRNRIAMDGDHLLIGAPERAPAGLTDAGAAYLYKHNGSSWGLIKKVFPNDSSAGYKFGGTVAIDSTAGRFSVSAKDDSRGINAGTVHLFDIP